MNFRQLMTTAHALRYMDKFHTAGCPFWVDVRRKGPSHYNPMLEPGYTLVLFWRYDPRDSLPSTSSDLVALPFTCEFTEVA